MNTEMENGMQLTFADYMPETFQELMCGASDSLAKTSPSEDTEKGLLETAQACFSELCTFLDSSEKSQSPLGCSSKMLKICLALMEDGTSPSFSLNWTRGGYDAEWNVYNSKYYGVPQNRERVFVIGHFRGRSGSEVFSDRITITKTALPIKRIAHLNCYRRTYQTFYQFGSCEALDTMQGGGRQPCVLTDKGIRRLTPRECLRLQGWDDDYISKAEFINSDSQLYKQAGNGVTVSVIHEIAAKIGESNEQ